MRLHADWFREALADLCEDASLPWRRHEREHVVWSHRRQDRYRGAKRQGSVAVQQGE